MKVRERVSQIFQAAGLAPIDAIVGDAVAQQWEADVQGRLAPILAALRVMGFDIREPPEARGSGDTAATVTLRSGRAPEGASREVLLALRSYGAPIARRTFIRSLRSESLPKERRDAIDNRNLKAVRRLVEDGIVSVTDRTELYLKGQDVAVEDGTGAAAPSSHPRR